MLPFDFKLFPLLSLIMRALWKVVVWLKVLNWWWHPILRMNHRLLCGGRFWKGDGMCDVGAKQAASFSKMANHSNSNSKLRESSLRRKKEHGGNAQAELFEQTFSDRIKEKLFPEILSHYTFVANNKIQPKHLSHSPSRFDIQHCVASVGETFESYLRFSHVLHWYLGQLEQTCPLAFAFVHMELMVDLSIVKCYQN